MDVKIGQERCAGTSGVVNRDLADAGAFDSSIQDRLKLRGSTGVPYIVVKTSAAARQAWPASRTSLS
jgi:hypothetical protein